jgi:hypothetical protein
MTSDPGFPDDYRGAGPMFAAVTLKPMEDGRPLAVSWPAVAAAGGTAYILRDPRPAPGHVLDVIAAMDRYAGWSAFLDRGQAEQVADHPGRSGEFIRWEGDTGRADRTRAAQARFDAEHDAEAS